MRPIPCQAGIALLALIVPNPTWAQPSPSPAPARPRTIVTADPELDDSNSLVRFLLYSTDVQTEGLIYASSRYHWKGDGKGTAMNLPGREYSRLGPQTSWRWRPGERFIDDAVEIYGHVYDNLKVHDANYPTPAWLRSKIREGNVELEGDISKDTPGSDLIKQVLLDDQGGPVYLLAWGGQSTIARALMSIQLQYKKTPQWTKIADNVSKKAIIQAFGDQDGTYASYIQPNWPKIEFRSMATDTWGYGARGVVLPEFAKYLSAPWTEKHVSRVGHLGAFYRVWGDGKQMVPGDIWDHFGFSGLTAKELKAKGYVVWTPVQEKGSWISEGDSSTFLNLLANGLRAYEDATYGGWGGRKGVDRDAQGKKHRDYATARWFEFAQLDFAARLRWSVTPTFAGANHAPKVSMTSGLNVTACPGETVALKATATDPDGNDLTFTWWQYKEAGTYPGSVTFSNAKSVDSSIQVPIDAKPGQTIHLVLQVTDNGTLALTGFQRVIVIVGKRTN
jgi:hypothetical protein